VSDNLALTRMKESSSRRVARWPLFLIAAPAGYQDSALFTRCRVSGMGLGSTPRSHSRSASKPMVRMRSALG
jgi:hypothetical protein